MPTDADIVAFFDPPVPQGASPYVPGGRPSTDIEVVEPDPSWPVHAEALMARIRVALGDRALRLDHVGSTAVPGLPAKPVLDLDLLVADPDDEAAYVPPLEPLGLRLLVREPWWYRHRMLRGESPRANLHVFGAESPEPERQRLFRDWLRAHPDDRDRYAVAKREASAATRERGGTVEQYNAHKQAVLREIHDRLFRAAGLLP